MRFLLSACAPGLIPALYGDWENNRVAFCAGLELSVNFSMEVHTP